MNFGSVLPSFPVNIPLLKVNNKHKKKMWNVFKVKYKVTQMMKMKAFQLKPNSN